MNNKGVKGASKRATRVVKSLAFGSLVTLVECFGLISAVIVGFLIDMVWLFNPKAGNKLFDIVVDFLEEDNE